MVSDCSGFPDILCHNANRQAWGDKSLELIGVAATSLSGTKDPEPLMALGIRLVNAANYFCLISAFYDLTRFNDFLSMSPTAPNFPKLENQLLSTAE